ncbi:MAG: glycosyltransferase [Planctomycetota bacterium]|nr:glycosyltransferase [Planctomycetota bacterium]
MSTESNIQVAYLVNLYPKVSHAFIRREILALEAQGMSVKRYAIRRADEKLVDDSDVTEAGKTSYLLDAGVFGLLMAVIRIKLTRPIRYLQALKLACQIGYGSDRGLLRHFMYLAEACVLEGQLRHEGVLHLHAHFGTNSTTVAMLCHTLGGPGYSFTAHGSAEFDRLDQIGITSKIDRARFVIAVSRFGRSQLMRKCPAEQWAKIHVVHCGVEDQLLEDTPAPIPETRRFVCVGRLCEQKAPMLLVEAMQGLRDDGFNCELVLVGDGELRAQVEQAIEDHAMGDSISITGWATGQEVRAQIEASRILILPSLVEGLPVVIMEAFARGRPVISTYVGGVPELVRPGENGWLVPAGDVDALILAMKEAMETPISRLGDMGLAGRKRVKAEHATKTEAGTLIMLFRNAMDGGVV